MNTSREPSESHWRDYYLEVISLSRQDRADLLSGLYSKWARLATILVYREFCFDLPENVIAYCRSQLVYQCTVIRSIPQWIWWHTRRQLETAIFDTVAVIDDPRHSV